METRSKYGMCVLNGNHAEMAFQEGGQEYLQDCFDDSEIEC